MPGELTALRRAVGLFFDASPAPRGASGNGTHPITDSPEPSRSQPRAQSDLQTLGEPDATQDAATAAPSSRGAAGVLVGEREHRFYVLRPEAIDYIEAHGNYVKFHVGNLEYIRRATLKHLWTALAEMGFMRIHRSLILNVRAVSYAQPVGRREYAFTLRSGVCLRSAAVYRSDIFRLLPLAPRARRPQ